MVQNMYVYCELFIAVWVKEIFVSPPCRWRDNSAETCSSYVKDFTLELQKCAFVGVGYVAVLFMLRELSTVSFVLRELFTVSFVLRELFTVLFVLCELFTVLLVLREFFYSVVLVT
jgi:hypothetical protein